MPKKYINQVLTLVAIALMGTACSAPPVNLASIPTNSQEVETEDTQEIANDIGGEYTQQALDFLEKLKLKESEAVSEALGVQGDSYSFLKDLEVTGYSVQRLENEVDQRFAGEQYRVILDVKKSTNERISEGKSEWLLVVPGVQSTIDAFLPEEEMVKEVTTDQVDVPSQYAEYKELYDMAYKFSYVTECYDTEQVPLDQMTTTSGVRLLHEFMHEVPSDGGNTITMDQLTSYIRETYGMEVTKAQKKEFIEQAVRVGSVADLENEVITVCQFGHGGGTYAVNALRDVKTMGEDQVVIEIDYYGDCSYFYKAKKVAYTFDKTTSGKWKLTLVKTLEETGYPIRVVGF